jgi:hypothetical protein
MLKKGFVILFISVFVNTTSAQNSHFAGVDLGVTFSNATYDPYRPELNLNYFLALKLFAIKTQFSLQPISELGLRTRSFLAIGFTTWPQKKVSWHLLTGIGFVTARKIINMDESSIYGSGLYGLNTLGTPIISSGFYIKPNIDKRIVFSLDAVFFYEPYLANGQVEQTLPISFAFSINYILNKK